LHGRWTAGWFLLNPVDHLKNVILVDVDEPKTVDLRIRRLKFFLSDMAKLADLRGVLL
jgi:hypothetical protein